MPKSLEDSRIFRDTLSGVTSDETSDEYYQKLKEFLIANEGYETQAYDDQGDRRNKKFYIKDILAKKLKSVGKITIGIGENLEKTGSRTVFNNLFQNLSGSERQDFDQVISGENDLTDAQVDRLFLNTRNEKLQRLKTEYGSAWNKFSAGQKIIIEDMFFQLEAYVRRGTTFHSNMVEYAKWIGLGKYEEEIANELFLKQAILQIKFNSNRHNDPGIQNRNNSRSIILNVADIPLNQEDLSNESVELRAQNAKERTPFKKKITHQEWGRGITHGGRMFPDTKCSKHMKSAGLCD